MRETVNSPQERVSPSADGEIAALAARQHGVVASWQLHGLGVDDNAIAYRVRAGRLHRLHRGVYAVGHTVLTVRGHWMAAVLAAGRHAVLSHAAAGALWGLRPSAAVIVDVTVPGTGGRPKRKGLRVHRARDLTGQTTTHDGIPVTTPARTILDLAASLQRRPLERLLDQAENTRLTDVPSLEALTRAHTGHRGASKLLATLDTHSPGTTLTRSGLEEQFLRLCRDARLPEPKVNHYVAGRERDFVFVAERVVVEIDSWAWHRNRRAFEDDRHRDQTLLLAGFRSLRFTDTQLEHAPRHVAATLSTVLDADRRAA